MSTPETPANVVVVVPSTASAVTLVAAGAPSAAAEPASKDKAATPAASDSDSDDVVDPTSPDFVRVRLSRFGFASVFVGLCISLFLTALDQTIVSTAIPAIVKEFQALNSIAWVGTGYLLTSTAFAPMYGKLTDIFGRKPTFLAAILIFEVGSLICGVANSMELLIFGRAFAGVGGAGIYSLVLIIISDIVSFRDRGKYQGFIGAVFGLSSVLGPLLGGAFTDGISWRWCFYINLPLGAVSLFVVTVFLRLPGPEGSVAAKLKRIDYLGTLFVLAATICLLISLEFGGKDWAWSDARTIVLLVLAVVLFAVFLVVEAKFAVEPLLPPSMYENPSVYSILAITFLLGASFFGLVYYIPTYFQIVSGNTATQAGLQTIPLVGGVVVFSIVSGQLVSRFGYYTPFFFVGSAFLVVGSALMSTLNQFSNRGMQIGYLLLAGVGIGNMIQIRILGIQASVTPHNIGAATAASAFFMFLGGSVGVAIVGSIFNNVLQNEIGTDLSELVTRNPTGVGSLPTAVRDKVLDGFSKAFDTSYKAIIPMAGLIFILALFVRQARPGARKAETVALGE